MGASKISFIINEELKRDKIDSTISKSTVLRTLRKEFGRPRKIKKTFHLTEKQKKQRMDFCKNIIKKGINGDNIFFSDETKIEMGSYIRDSIRLSRNSKNKLKKGEQEIFDLINRPQKKFEPSIMVAGGVCSFGLSNLILIEGSENEFSYAQALLNYKDDFDRLKGKGINSLIFEQDGATLHTSASNRQLIIDLFGEKNFLQNPPNFPDLAYPIESIWGYIKPRIKKRNPGTLEELKKVALEEWNNLPRERIKKCSKNYLRRIKKVIEIKGNRLEEFHLRQIRKEAKENNDEIEEDEEGKAENIFDGMHEEKKEKEENTEGLENLNKKRTRGKSLNYKKNGENDEKLKMKIIYNDRILNIKRKKQIANLRKKISAIKKKASQEIKKVNEKTIRVPGIVEYRKKKKQYFKKNKEEKIKEIMEQINQIENMDIIEYIKYTKKDKKSQGTENFEEESTIDDSINKILKIKEFNSDETIAINYEIEF